MGIEAEPTNFKNYKSLALAICVEACNDYVEYSKEIVRLSNLIEEKKKGYVTKHMMTRLSKKLEHTKNEVDSAKNFFKSDWFDFITSVCLGKEIEPELVIRKLNERIKKELEEE